MKEYLTDAIVLQARPKGESDRIINLYTKDFGRIEAKVIGGRKILSKLSPHLDLINLVAVRLVQKNQFTLADALVADRFKELRRDAKKLLAALTLLSLIKSLTPLSMPDLRLWYELRRGLKEGKINYRIFLKLLGYDPTFARCEVCEGKLVNYFLPKEQMFLCAGCKSCFPEKEMIFLWHEFRRS